MDINGYLNEIRKLAASGQATEHSYRPALERLFKSIDVDLTVINEPRRLTDVGAPDFDTSMIEQSNMLDMDMFRLGIYENISKTRTEDQPK